MNRKSKSQEITLISLFSALTALGAFISIPLGPVSITLQTLFVLLSGFLLKPKSAALSQIVYIVLGLVGLPIFSGFTGGLQSFLKPSFGFLIGFILASFVASLLASKKNTIPGLFLAGIVATMIMYLIGLPYMAFILNYIMKSGFTFKAILNMGVLIFLPGDIIKLSISVFLGFRLREFRQR